MRQFIYLAMAVSAVIGFGHSNASAQVINGCIKGNGTLIDICLNNATLSGWGGVVECDRRDPPRCWPRGVAAH
jgi:hypothetical protein